MWNAVAERDRKDLFEDVLFFLAKKEKEDEKKLHMYNKQYLMDTFAKLDGLTHRTLWSEVGIPATVFISVQILYHSLSKDVICKFFDFFNFQAQEMLKDIFKGDDKIQGEMISIITLLP